ncbi:DUF559 domain-containing protein [bacterium]|nr:DUF559 domain-containing protein [bacterium]
MAYTPYRKNLTALSRKLRKNSTQGEIALWKRLRNRQCSGLQFNRQKPLGNYIADFYCKAVNLVIEIDGYSHTFESAHQKDLERQKDLETMGIKVLRFTEGEARNNTDQVLRVIEAFVQAGAKSP